LVGGSCIVPSFCNPRPISPESTWIAGTSIRTGGNFVMGATEAAAVAPLSGDESDEPGGADVESADVDGAGAGSG